MFNGILKFGFISAGVVGSSVALSKYIIRREREIKLSVGECNWIPDDVCTRDSLNRRILDAEIKYGKGDYIIVNPHLLKIERDKNRVLRIVGNEAEEIGTYRK
jgi:hypothetical protein